MELFDGSNVLRRSNHEKRVLDGTTTVKDALKQDALKRPLKGGGSIVRPGDKLDPVLAHHLRRSHL